MYVRNTGAARSAVLVEACTILFRNWTNRHEPIKLVIEDGRTGQSIIEQHIIR